MVIHSSRVDGSIQLVDPLVEVKQPHQIQHKKNLWKALPIFFCLPFAAAMSANFLMLFFTFCKFLGAIFHSAHISN